MEASHFTNVVNTPLIKWELIADIGRTGSGMAVTPVTAQQQNPGQGSPELDYKMMLFDTGKVSVQVYFSPTLNFNGKELRYALSIDDGSPKIFNLHSDYTNQSWQNWVANNIIIDPAAFHISSPGIHILKFWMVDPGIVLQKIVVDLNGVKPSYLGPPETLVKISKFLFFLRRNRGK